MEFYRSDITFEGTLRWLFWICEISRFRNSNESIFIIARLWRIIQMEIYVCVYTHIQIIFAYVLGSLLTF